MAPGKLCKIEAVASTTNILLFTYIGKHIDEAKECIKKGKSAKTDLAKIESFASIKPIANCFTATHSDFVSLLHKNRDYTPLAYDWWWTAKWKSAQSCNMWLDPDVNYKDMKGGAFHWSSFGVAVDFER
jgi:hypothetical protein